MALHELDNAEQDDVGEGFDEISTRLSLTGRDTRSEYLGVGGCGNIYHPRVTYCPGIATCGASSERILYPSIPSIACYVGFFVIPRANPNLHIKKVSWIYND